MKATETQRHRDTETNNGTQRTQRTNRERNGHAKASGREGVTD